MLPAVSLFFVVLLTTASPFNLLNSQLLRSPLLEGPNFASRYFIPRNVTVRQTTRSILPFQIYRGSRLDVPSESIVASSYPSDWTPFSETSKFHSKLSADRLRQQQMKAAVTAKASQPLDADKHLHIVYYDEHICVVNKPSGVLSVPGPRRHPSLADLVQDALSPCLHVDRMIVHRLDMETTGVLVFALTELALKNLHEQFRFRRVEKTYQAILCGHLDTTEVEIDIPLERDSHHPPFMKVSQSRRKEDYSSIVHETFRKFIDKAPKPSLTRLVVKSLEYLRNARNEALPVSRVLLMPHTGRTHQLRVHTAWLGYPIVGDSIYGYHGEGNCGVMQNNDGLNNGYSNTLSIRHKLHDMGKPLCLHAETLALTHPLTGAYIRFECEAPF